MSTAMEKMVANMLGFTPEQMHETLNGFRDIITTTKATLDRIEAKLDDHGAMLRDLHIAQEKEEIAHDTRDGNDAG